MKKKLLALLLVIVSFSGFSQELTKNNDTGLFEYTEIISSKRDINEIEKRLTELGYYDINKTENSISSTGKKTEKFNMFSVETTYNVFIDIKEDKYRIKVSNFYINDFKSNYQLENMGGYQKKWLKKTNEKLPEIVEKLKSLSTNSNW